MIANNSLFILLPFKKITNSAKKLLKPICVYGNGTNFLVILKIRTWDEISAIEMKTIFSSLTARRTHLVWFTGESNFIKNSEDESKFTKSDIKNYNGFFHSKFFSYHDGIEGIEPL